MGVQKNAKFKADLETVEKIATKVHKGNKR
jgi:hypothetical protein